MLESEIIWRPVKTTTLKIIHYILACCSVKDKAQLQIARNTVTYIEMLFYRRKNLRK